MDDQTIIEEISKGNIKAFNMLYDRYGANVFNTALSYTKHQEDAEEVTQDVFVKIYKSADSFKGKSLLSTWIYRITVNTSLNFIKKRKRRLSFNTSLSDTSPTDFNHPGVQLEQKENAAALFKAIDYLPETQKTAFILSYIEDLPRQEVADIMETSLKAVESLLQRAKKKMRIEIGKMYPYRRNFKN